jgi:hypothetical protein
MTSFTGRNDWRSILTGLGMIATAFTVWALAGLAVVGVYLAAACGLVYFVCWCLARFGVLALLPLVLVAALCAPASAERYACGDQVCHTRLVPVIAHRLSPPYHGRHVYAPRVPASRPFVWSPACNW